MTDDRAESFEGQSFDPSVEKGDPILDTLWARALEAWDDDKVHVALLEHALRVERLPDLAAHYRALKDDAVKGPRARKRLDALVVAATQMLYAMKTPAPKRAVPWWMTAVAFIFCASVLLWLARMILFRAR